jgi:hypothetical protein
MTRHMDFIAGAVFGVALACLLLMLNTLPSTFSTYFSDAGVENRRHKIAADAGTFSSPFAPTGSMNTRTTSHQCSSVLNYIYAGIQRSNTSEVSRQHSESKADSPLPSIYEIWQQTVHPNLLNHVISWAHAHVEMNTTIIDHDKMEEVYRKVHNEFSIPNLRKSQIRHMESQQLHKILDIIHRRLHDPHNNPRLEIMTFGGSVVAGANSNFHSWWQPGYSNGLARDQPEFSWPTRLEAVFNDVIFRGQDVVRVINMGGGGAASDVGAMVLEYRVFMPEYPVPDIIIHSYGVNDILSGRSESDRLGLMQEFVNAAKRLRCDGLPSVVLYDDFMGLFENNEPWRPTPFSVDFNMEYFRSVSQLSAWYSVMAVSYANAFRHLVYSSKDFGSTGWSETNPGHLPMLDWHLEVHPGMLFHSTSQWVLAYNLLDGMINACHDLASPMTRIENFSDELSVEQIPTLTSELNLRDLPIRWKESMANYQQRCANFSLDNPCSLNSWVVYEKGGVQSPRQIQTKMDDLLVSSNKDWVIQGKPGGKPRPGWVANGLNATFTITVKDHKGVTSITIVSMKSYSKLWIHSRLRLTVWDEGPDGMGPSSDIGQFTISGFHELRTSVLFPHKLHLEKHGVPEGHWLKARFDLISGGMFRIQGMFFCSH